LIVEEPFGSETALHGEERGRDIQSPLSLLSMLFGVRVGESERRVVAQIPADRRRERRVSVSRMTLDALAPATGVADRLT